MYKTYKRKIKLNKLSRKIKRLVKLHGKVKLEIWQGRGTRNLNPYGMRYLNESGECQIHYCDYANGFNGRGRQKCCFFEDYAVYRNDDGDEKVFKSLDDTLRAMQRHDGKYYKVRAIHIGKRRIEVK